MMDEPVLTTLFLPVVCLLACAATLWCEAQSEDSGDRAETMQKLKVKTKLLASLAFVGFAWDQGAADSEYGRVLLVGLVLSLVGDVLLALTGNKKWFVLGIGAFLLAHVAYALAFGMIGSETSRLPLVAPLVVLTLAGIGVWLRTHLTGIFVLAVPAYLLAIGVMLIMAWLVPNSLIQFWVMTGATLFAISDVFVARNRFVSPAFENRLIGLPIYYVAQLMLAYSVVWSM
jgi:uncharacterized membrane protein YhhN